MLKINHSVLALIVSVIYAIPAFGLTLEAFESRENSLAEQQMIEAYLHGLGSGLEYANARLGLKGESKLYCQPGGLALNPGNYISLIEGVASRHDFLPNDPIDVMLLVGLEIEFPCP